MKNHVKLFYSGAPRIHLNGADITELFSLKSLGILYLLYEARHQKLPREKMAAILWETSDDKAARYNLRYNIWTINKVMADRSKAERFIEADRSSLAFSASFALSSDCDDLVSLSKARDEAVLVRIKDSCGINYLEGFYIKDCNYFNDWVFFQRERLQKNYSLVLERLRVLYDEKKDHDRGIGVLEEMLALNPYDEQVYGLLIRILLEKGDRVGALNRYNQCINVLREELNIAPLDSTKALYDLIHSSKEAENHQATRLEITLNTSKYARRPYGFMAKLLKALVSSREYEDFLRQHKTAYSGLHFLLPQIFEKGQDSDFPGRPEAYDHYLFSLSLGLLRSLTGIRPIGLTLHDTSEMDEVSGVFLLYVIEEFEGSEGLRIVFTRPWFKALDNLASRVFTLTDGRP